jgi:D-alanyl-D-alanine carboxypeptidase
MKKLYFSLLFLLMVHGAHAQFNASLATLLQDTLNTYTAMISSIKGLSVAVNVPGQGIWTGTSGISYTGKPITSDMRMGIASNTKLFVITIMLKLAEDKILSLDDSVKKWLPTYTNVNPNIKIRQLLNHTSGLPEPIFVSPWMDTIKKYPTRVFTPTEVVGWIGAPLGAPGTVFNYSNVNYVLAGMIAKAATGIHISKLIRDSILTPLNMDSTFYDVEEPTNGVLAHRWWNSVDYNDTSRVGLNTAGGCAGALFSTASEMVQWYVALFDKKIINQASLNEISNFLPTGTAGYDYGLGFSRSVTQGYKYWGHGGDTWGYKSLTIYDSCLHVAVGGYSNSYPSGLDAVVFLLYKTVKTHVPSCVSGALSGTTTVCAGTSGVTYTIPAITGATSYVWELPTGVTGTSTTNSITVNFALTATSGTIIVRGVNSYGAGGWSSIDVTVNPKPAKPIISLSGLITLNSSAPSGNQWYNESGIIIGATGTSYICMGMHTYYCIVTLAGCKSDTSDKIYVTEDIYNVNSSNAWQLYPNPAEGYFNCRTTGAITNDLKLNVYSLTGVLVKSIAVTQTEQKVSTTDISKGIYIVELKSNTAISRKLLSVQ